MIKGIGVYVSYIMGLISLSSTHPPYEEGLGERLVIYYFSVNLAVFTAWLFPPIMISKSPGSAM